MAGERIRPGSDEKMEFWITQIDTACMLLDINGFWIVTDPVFDQAGGIPTQDVNGKP